MLSELTAKLPIGRTRPAPHRPRLLVEEANPGRCAKKVGAFLRHGWSNPGDGRSPPAGSPPCATLPPPLGEAARPHQSYVVVYRDTLLTDVPELVDLLRRLLGPPA